MLQIPTFDWIFQTNPNSNKPEFESKHWDCFEIDFKEKAKNIQRTIFLVIGNPTLGN